jgi:hypothetical protein
MSLRNLQVCLSVIALSALPACGKKSKSNPSPKVEEPKVEEPKVEQPTLPPPTLGKTATLKETCEKLKTDSFVLTAGLRDICLASKNGVNQVKLNMLVKFGDEARVVKGGNYAEGGLTRDVSKLLSVKTAAELKSLICSTNADQGSESQTRNDLFDIFYARYAEDDIFFGWKGGTQTGEISSDTVASELCSEAKAQEDFSVKQIILTE